jgi:hypothetical protein
LQIVRGTDCHLGADISIAFCYSKGANLSNEKFCFWFWFLSVEVALRFIGNLCRTAKVDDDEEEDNINIVNYS